MAATAGRISCKICRNLGPRNLTTNSYYKSFYVRSTTQSVILTHPSWSVLNLRKRYYTNETKKNTKQGQ